MKKCERKTQAAEPREHGRSKDEGMLKIPRASEEREKHISPDKQKLRLRGESVKTFSGE